jgi:hypothetical protein
LKIRYGEILPRCNGSILKTFGNFDVLTGSIPRRAIEENLGGMGGDETHSAGVITVLKRATNGLISDKEKQIELSLQVRIMQQ